MNSLKEKIYRNAPHIVHNGMITLYNILSYRNRYGGNYKTYLKKYANNANLSLEELKNIQAEKFKAFVKYAKNNSSFYNELYADIDTPEDINNIESLPIVNKEILRSQIQKVYTVDKKEGHLSKTGGTTGKSLEVLFTKEDVQERFALLDHFRGGFGYKLGKKTAWFSGKNLLTPRDVKKKRFWKTDYLYKVRYYSTFHIHEKHLQYYLRNLIKYKPLYMVGFPSTMYEIAKYGINNNIDFPKNTIKAIFPTAETITTEIRQVLETFFKTNLYNQYASSEGAPFIIECKHKNLHLELQSGVFEVLDDNNNPSQKGRLVVTSFNTHGTPLIRYDIGDQIELKEGACSCGNHNPLVKQILGRISDYVYSEETGKINLGNISNCLKGVKGIVKFQIQQYQKNALIVLIVNDSNTYSLEKDEKLFLKNLRDRVGNKMEITVKYVEDIPVEASGKYRLVKNMLQ